MEKQTPSSFQTFSALFNADLKIQWRNRRASLMSIIVPIIILVSWKNIVLTEGGGFALASCITIGLIAVGLMGYANTTARDREKGVFQRLRVTPADTSQIMVSRIAVQLVQMGIMTIAVLIAGYFLDHIVLSVGGYILGTIISLLCGAVFLGLGLAIVGLIPNAETVNSVTRLVYIALIVIGVIGELGVLGNVIKQIVVWSPYGTVKVVLQAALSPATWTPTSWIALAASVAYVLVFTGIGIKWFSWSTK